MKVIIFAIKKKPKVPLIKEYVNFHKAKEYNKYKCTNIYTFLYSCTTVLAFMNVCMYEYVCVCIYLFMYVYVYMYVCMHVCMYVCIYVCMYVCMYICIYMYV